MLARHFVHDRQRFSAYTCSQHFQVCLPVLSQACVSIFRSVSVSVSLLVAKLFSSFKILTNTGLLHTDLMSWPQCQKVRMSEGLLAVGSCTMH